MTRALVISSLLILALVAPLSTATAEEERFEISIEEVIALEDLLERVRETTGAPLVWDTRTRALQNKEVSGGVHLAGTRQEVLEAVRDLLLAYELVLVPVGGGENEKLVVADARQTQAILRLKPRYVELNDDNLAAYEQQASLFVATTVSVKHMESLGDARVALSRIVSPQNIGSVTEVPAARAFVLTDFAPKVVALYRLIRQMDVPPEERGPEVADREIVFRGFPLAHARATDAVQVLGRHFGTTRPPKPEPGQRRRPQPRPVVTPPDHLHIDADVRLNQILVTGMRRDVERVAAVIQTLDRPAPQPPVQVQVIGLAHIDAVRAAAALVPFIHRSQRVWLDGTGSDMGALPVVVADPQTNSLLVQATPRIAEQLRRVIATLDEAKQDAEAADGD